MRGTFLPLVVLTFATFPLQAQLPIGFGLKGGARLTDFTESASNVTTHDHVYTIGPYGELHLPLGFSIEVDLLYKRSGSTLQNVVTSLPPYTQFTMSSFDIPILAKKTFKTEMIFRPFVEAGLATRYSTGIPAPLVATPLANPSQVASNSTTSGWQTGFVLGGGIQFKVLILKFTGELRWSRFGNIPDTIPKLNANQGEFLLGVGF